MGHTTYLDLPGVVFVGLIVMAAIGLTTVTLSTLKWILCMRNGVYECRYCGNKKPAMSIKKI